MTKKQKPTKPGSKTRPDTGANRRRLLTRAARIWPALAIVGGILFVLGNIGARTGWVIFPFDTHHLFTQWGGLLLLIVGFSLAGRR
jgi:hypothetical protein